MHRRAPWLICAFMLSLLILTACDLTGIPVASTQTATPEANPTTNQPTQPPATALPTDTPLSLALPTQTGVVAQATPSASPATETNPQPTGTATALAGSGATTAENQQLNQIETNTAQLRGLKPKAPVTDQFLTQQQLRSNLLADQTKDYTQADARRDATELWLLRLVDNRSIDLYQLQIDLLTEQVIGYYDPDTKKLFVLGSQSQLTPLERQTIAHEYTHGLQDQYFDLNKLIPQNNHNDDRDLAVTSLVEGDATISGLMFAYRYMSSSDFQQMMNESQNASSTVLDSAPQYIRDSLLFPYQAGENFVGKLIENGNFKAVDQALKDPPASTEQIMHPEKYTSSPRDNPMPVSLPPLTSTLGTGWTYADGNTTGEFDTQELLTITGASNPQEAAAGWGGGRYAMYENGNSALYIESLKWDTSKDADEFEAALRETFANLQHDSNTTWNDGSRYFGIKRVQDQVTLVSSTDSASLQKALSAVK